MSTNGPAVSFSGLGTGIDTASIVQALMRLERAPIDRVERDKRALQQKQGVVQELNGLLTKLRDAAAKLYAPGALAAKQATSANAAVASASAGPQAAAGTYNVSVTALAQAHTMASATAPGLTPGDTLDVTVGGETVSVTIQAGDDLQALAERINAQEGAGASASVVNDRLVLISGTSGAGGAITVGGTAAGALGFTTTQAGQDAQATINGLAVTSSGNTIAGAINGVDLTLAGTGTTTVTVGADTAAIEKQVKDFVDAYNALVSNVNNATRYDAATRTAGTLQGDQTVTALGAQVRAIAGSAVAGLGGAYDSLSQIGITSSRDGTLTLDSARFQAALAADPAAVRAVLGRDDGSGAVDAGDGIARRLQAFADSFSSDVMSARLTGYTASLTRMNDRIAGLEAVMVIKEERLRAQFAAMERAVFQFQSQGADLAARLGALGLN